jgi:multisubunit Na+/H+ antiporter MnhF subunit
MTELRITVLIAALTTLALAFALSFIRVVRGPSPADRLVGLDLCANIGAGLMGVAGIAYDDHVFLDIAIIIVVTGFVGTAAFAQLLGTQKQRFP